ncbi:MAG TPA: WXG100 family type VII secretion target [Herpetosiphon sp.]|uniref:ESAT-6-like protein n=1 Tax=Herpetosiphon aurantiacus (strain ATCC 23779 / DSM 785 / 114-95) TaxID=316274 RepID=A9B0A6_HERA2|nr:WXG100 family type VII secretion target [Herpetosiphon sp.]ABX05215.1 protein of unknown function DUF909 [Herpetosiphon aurantiacus DSM 785]HBW51275.1 WXG100 family type VII secretion target [Herpetosiphon sp.]
MAEKTKFDPQVMQQAAATFGKAHEGLQDVNQEVLSIANTLQESLKGDAGNEFVETLQIMAQSVAKFAAKMTEIQNDIKVSMQQMADTDNKNSQMF